MKLQASEGLSLKMEDNTIDQETFSSIMIAMAIIGLKSFKLLTSDINFNIFEKSVDVVTKKLGSYTPKDSIQDLMELGMSFFPAFILIHMPLTEQMNVKIIPIAEKSKNYNLEDASKGIFIAFSYLYLIGSLPADNIYRPKILKDIYGDDFKPYDLIMDVFNCNLSKLDGKWIRTFPFQELPEKLKNRFSISMGGTRQMGSFVTVTLKTTTPQNVIDLQTKMKDYLLKGLFWDLHPLFRTSENINKTGSLNKALNAIIGTYGTKDSVDILCEVKYLYAVPLAGYIDPKIFNFDEANWSSDKVNSESSMLDEIKNLIDSLNN
jgi:hypothetical protein